MRKEKLTLSVDEEVVKKARALDINISQATEMALRGFTAGSGEADANQIRAAYDYLFRAMMPTMLLLDTTVEVGFEADPQAEGSSLYLEPDGKLFWWHNTFDEATDTSLDKVKLSTLHNPAKIVSNWLDQLKQAKEKNPERLKTIQLYSGIVEVMSKTLIGSVSQRGPKSGNRPQSKGREAESRRKLKLRGALREAS